MVSCPSRQESLTAKSVKFRRMNVKHLAMMLTVCLVSALFGQTTWPHEPPGSTLIADWDISALSGKGFNTNAGNATIIDDATAPGSPSKVLECRRNSNQTGGCTHWRGGFAPNQMDIYVGFWWKPSNPFYGWAVGNQKLVYMQMYDQTLDLGMKGPQGGPFTLGFGNQGLNNGHVAGCEREPTSCVFANNHLPIALGQWHQVEFIIKRSTSLTSRNGSFTVWMDNKLAGQALNINTGRVYEQFNFLQAWDSPIWLPQMEWHRFDHVRMSIPNGATSGIQEKGLPVVASPLTVEPKAGKMAFRMSQPGAYELSVHDISGRAVWRHEGNGEAVWNHGGKLTRGVYLVRAEQNGKSLITRYSHIW